ncbi:four-carbon acid sugar kinase family protein [Echinicola jeungdonensis]|uniref:Four-carbon acid sugar kinase family protein n=1 Tax=Echinicola jeungdonensis TaxID=709343 RepID=A0ABV5J3S8_9BACT|nr:four-carbon acid sugar kinase family protein [Echinicola jeungdonensis]MDN3669364.1 four-carbon acid sugar kinase family protein [Echinicola jeungdonensis]
MIAVIADDITGAAEIAGVCLRWGIPVSFSLDVKPVSGAKVMVIASNTRSMKEADAIKESKRLAEALVEMKVDNVFKKSDSVMRGHVAAEMKALAAQFKKEKMMLVPANPYTGRSIRDGIYYVDQKPLNETSFKDDPEFPAASSSVKELLREEELNVCTGKFTEEQDLKPGFNIPDSKTMGDLYAWASLMDSTVLPSGSAAFFEMYLKRNFPEWMHGQEPDPLSFLGNSLMVAGSTHQNSKNFIDKAVENGTILSLMPKELKSPNAPESGVTKWSDEITKNLKGGDKVIMSAGKEKVTFENSNEVLKTKTAETVAKVLDRVPVRELLIEGGATAFAVIQQLHMGPLLPLQELSPGVVRMKAVDSDLVLTIKPGSYVWPEAVYKYYEMKKTTA